MSARFAWEDLRAGLVDAKRTTSPRVLAGFRIGGLDYALGFAFGTIGRRLP